MAVMAEKLFSSLLLLRHKARRHGDTGMHACIEFEKKIKRRYS